MAHGEGNKAVFAALGANLGIAVTKAIAFALTGSSSMLAEAIHSVVDSGNQGLLLLGGKRARRAPDAEHPFGYGRTRYVYGFIVSVMLFTLGGVLGIYEGIHKWSHAEPITEWRWVPIAVLVIAIALEGSSFRTAVAESRPARAGRSLVSYVRTAKSPELPVVLLEDAGALVGLLLALIGIGLTLITGDGRWDAAGTASIGVLLLLIALVLAGEMASLLVGEAADPAQVRAIAAALPGEGVDSVIHLRTLHLGPEELLVAAKIAVPGAHSAADVAAAIDAAERRVRAAVPFAAVIYLEPDLRQGDPVGDAVRGPRAP